MATNDTLNDTTAPDGTVSDGTDVNSILAVTTESYEYAVYRAIPKEGEDTSKLPLGFGILKDGNDLYKSVNGYKDAKGNDHAPDTVILRTAKVTQPIIHKYEGIAQVFTDPDEAVAVVMQGLSLKLKSQLRNKLTATEEASGDFSFQGDEISYDEILEILNTPVQRRNLTEGQKAMKAVSQFSPETLAAVLASLGYTKAAE